MSWLYSRALVAEYSAEYSSDGEQSAPSSSTTMPAMFLSHGKTTEASNLSRYGMMCEPLTDIDGEVLLTWFLEDSHARISALREKVLESTETEAGSGKKWPASLARYDRDTYSWKTAQFSLLGDSELFSGTWPRWGIMRNGECWERSTPGRRTEEIESGLWGTPTVNDAKNSLTESQRGRGTLTAHLVERMWPTPRAHEVGNYTRDHGQKGSERPTLTGAVKLWPTPRTAGMCGGTGNWEQLKEKCENMEEARKMGAGNGGQLNPDWVEWLMGWPIGWTDLRELETDRFLQWFDSHGKY